MIFRAENFPSAGPDAWLDRDDAEEAVEKRLRHGEIDETEAALCRAWFAAGYVVIPRLIDTETLDDVWSDYEEAIQRGRIVLEPESAGEGDPYPGRYLNPHKKCASFCRLLKHPGLLDSMRLLIGRDPKPLQTIAAHKGSQQGLHSDSIHMTTHPLGYLIAAWIAFEDIAPQSGPLVYYPGSHRLPYVFSKDVGIAEQALKEEGYAPYHARYEPRIRQLVEAHGLKPHHFHAKKGDVLLWHANLIHGGSPRQNLAFSRKSVVCHFFGKKSFVYHDLAASRSKQQYLGTCMLRDQYGRLRLL